MSFQLHRALNVFTWAFLMFFLAPTAMVIVSWNALPGDWLYGTKLAMERTVAVLSSVSYAKRAAIETVYTKKRSSEAHVLLAGKQSTQGLEYLSDQIETTKKAIDNSKDAQSKAEASQAYIDALSEVYAQLEQDKQQFAEQNAVPLAQVQQAPTQIGDTGTSRILPPKRPTPSPTVAGSQPPANTSGDTQSRVQYVYVTVQIVQTQQIIRETIRDLNQNTQSPPPSSSPEPTATRIPTPTNSPTPTQAQPLAPAADIQNPVESVTPVVQSPTIRPTATTAPTSTRNPREKNPVDD